MTDETPRTEAGRAAWAKADGLGPKIDTITMTAREYRKHILAIEREAADKAVSDAALEAIRQYRDTREYATHPLTKATAAPPEPTLNVEALRMQALRMQVLRLGGVLEGFAHGVGTRSSKPSDPDYDVRWECLCGIDGAPERVERHWLTELRKWASLHKGPKEQTDE